MKPNNCAGKSLARGVPPGLRRFWQEQQQPSCLWSLDDYLTLVERYRRTLESGQPELPLLVLPRRDGKQRLSCHWLPKTTGDRPTEPLQRAGLMAIRIGNKEDAGARAKAVSAMVLAASGSASATTNCRQHARCRSLSTALHRGCAGFLPRTMADLLEQGALDEVISQQKRSGGGRPPRGTPRGRWPRPARCTPQPICPPQQACGP